MSTIAEGIYRRADIGSTVTLPKAGTCLENPYVFDSSARDIKGLERRGLVQIVRERQAERAGGTLITELVFKKLG